LLETLVVRIQHLLLGLVVRRKKVRYIYTQILLTYRRERQETEENRGKQSRDMSDMSGNKQGSKSRKNIYNQEQYLCCLCTGRD
jgi:hypothetical protein